MNVIRFPAAPFVVITRELVTETRWQNRSGESVHRYEPPVPIFFLHYHEEDGLACCVWDGQTYDGALAAARTWADEGVTVRDRTPEVRGRA